MTAIAHHPHRVTRAMAGVRDQLGAVAGVPLWSMDAAETTTAISEVQAAKAQLAELEARLVAQAEALDIPGRSGATSTATWLAHHIHTTPGAAHRTVRLAAGLGSHDQTRDALAEGRVHVEQAEAVLRALDDLPADLDPSLVQDAEAHLLAEAEHFDARALKRFGRRLLEVVDPDAADAHEAQAPRTRGTRRGRRHPAHDVGGRTRQGPRPVHPRHPHRRRAQEGAPGVRRPQAPGRLRSSGGTSPNPGTPGAGVHRADPPLPHQEPPEGRWGQRHRRGDHDPRRPPGRPPAANLDTGETISASLARKLACEAGIIPAVLGGKSQVLDLGRTRRFHTGPQRIAKTIEQRGCTAEGCDWPPGLCHLHHPIPWSRGGGTDNDGLLLCPRHHARAHDPTYTTTHLPGGKVAFTRRT